MGMAARAVSHYVFCIAFVPLSRNYLLMFNTDRMLWAIA